MGGQCARKQSPASKVSWCLAFWVRMCVSRVELESLFLEALRDVGLFWVGI